LRKVANVLGVHFLGDVSEIEVHVDVDVEVACHRKHTVDLGARIGIGVWRGADDARTLRQRSAHELLGSRNVGEALLRKNTDLQIDRPLVGGRDTLDACKTAQADAGVYFDVGTEVRGPVDDGFFQCDAGAREDVVLGERALRLGHLRDRLVQRAVTRIDAVENARFVEVNVRLDEPRHDQLAVEIDPELWRAEVARDCADAAARDADVDLRGQSIIRSDRGIAQDPGPSRVMLSRDTRVRAPDRGAAPPPFPRARWRRIP
jgi:hypothetical protein